MARAPCKAVFVFSQRNDEQGGFDKAILSVKDEY